MIEINANPHRLDLDAHHCRRAQAKGVTIVINPDAHSVPGLDDLDYGISVARRGWLRKNDIWNTGPGAAMVRRLEQFRSRRR
jgi:DNA polymerase (family 10)